MRNVALAVGSSHSRKRTTLVTEAWRKAEYLNESALFAFLIIPLIKAETNPLKIAEHEKEVGKHINTYKKALRKIVRKSFAVILAYAN